MNTLVLPNGFGISIVGEGLTLLGLPTERSAKHQLSGSADEVVKTIAEVFDQMLVTVIEKKTAEDFGAAMQHELPKYIRLVLSLSAFVGSVAPLATINRLADESLCELEADIRDNALLAFGADMRDRGIFAVWTLRKISGLLRIATAEKLSDGNREKHTEFFTNFLYCALRARFSIDCLTAAMRLNRTIYPEALPVLTDYLRSVVDAYAWIRQAVDLRWPIDNDVQIQPAIWDAEDQELLDESMIDMATELG